MSIDNQILTVYYDSRRMRGIICEAIGHHIITAVTSKTALEPTAFVLFEKGKVAEVSGSPESLLNRITGPVFRFLSMIDDPEVRIHYGVKLMTKPNKLLKIMADYSPVALAVAVENLPIGHAQNRTADCAATAVVNYFTLSHTGLVCTAERIAEQFGEDEYGALLVETYLINRKLYLSFWEHAELAKQVKQRKAKHCRRLLEAIQRRSEGSRSNYNTWVSPVDTTNSLDKNLMFETQRLSA